MTAGAGRHSGPIGRLGSLDAATRAKVQAGCNFVNAEVARVRKRVTVLAAVAVVVAFIWWVLAGGGDPRLPFFTAFIVITLFTQRERKQLASSYKGIVIKRIVAALGRGLTYKPTSTLRQADFHAMDLFSERIDRWKSEDEVSGKKNAVQYSLHEVEAARKDSRGRHRFLRGSSLEILALGVSAAHRGKSVFFRGLVIRLDFNKNFAGHTVVIPDRESQILGGLFGESETRRRKQIVRMENVDFENQFSVYSTNDQEARYLITPKLMELVMEAQALLGAELRLCFRENSLFVTVPQSRDRFEVNMFGAAVTPESALGDLVEVVNLAERLVDTLDLETRIWTRV